jgi:diaminopropionate ammonia-lyase
MFYENKNNDYREPIEASLAEYISDSNITAARKFFNYYFGEIKTPLVALPGLARKANIARLDVKDESTRLELGSFKALGGAYAVMRFVQREAEKRLGKSIPYDALLEPEVRAIAREITVCCATDGNHGRSVAMGARRVGCQAVIFLHEGVSEQREKAIKAYGAATFRIHGTYDDSVVEASAMAEEKGWFIVSDTSWPGYEEIPATVMQGYGVMCSEVLDDLDLLPTHIFLQAGVGGLAAAVAGFFALHFPENRPKIIVVEPRRAACLLNCNEHQERVPVVAGEPTVMAMLECYEASYIAWRILSRVVDFFMTVDEEDAIEAMRQLALPNAGDPAIVSGESGGVGLAALNVMNRNEDFRSRAGLDASSRVLVFNTEGATDPQLYERLVGVPAEKIRGR